MKKNHSFLWNFAYETKQFFYQLLRVDIVRQFIAAIRYFCLVIILRRLKTLEPDTGDVGVNTVFMNLKGLKTFSYMGVNRSNLMVQPLTAIRVSRSAPVLSIGPRSEGEILNLLGAGFRNVRGLDLMTYSPWIDLGDMHAMPYKDNAFEVTMLGWVITYSDNRKKAADEIIRVTRNGGIVAVGVEYTSISGEQIEKNLGYEVCGKDRLESVQAILDLFGDHVDHIYFSHDLPKNPPKQWQLMVHFSIKK
ncbi:MAG: methyltransferase domain-containing protein [Candidatus Peribacter sp.]|jgi:hypothetical protein|nr:methyltransferase domain-containing protein [Candidatus Peribacter sp.]MBT4393155.1 methyltransferase domain-containing protein [Candidatus Peribacter sp.]MBT4600501.1 methyltransferase domain-containing protein [Candidatus Peribacter sp.]MBT5148523.1 methyltransferase domain-containing protein [Candidatus Peribacter sp.]MBT5638690.1 methyltransferase domain-containing protein [Candidatus Peribacter sp.]